MSTTGAGASLAQSRDFFCQQGLDLEQTTQRKAPTAAAMRTMAKIHIDHSSKSSSDVWCSGPDPTSASDSVISRGTPRPSRGHRVCKCKGVRHRGSPVARRTFCQMQRLLGRGSQKEVTAARPRVGGGEQLVALMRSAVDGRQGEADLLREAIVMRRLGEHPHVLPLLRVGIDPCMRAFAEAPIAAHGSLNDLLDELEFEGRLADFGDAHVEQVLVQVRLALAHVHASGLRHCDVNTRNVLAFSFSTQPPAVEVKLCDFGSARAVRSREGVEGTAALEAELLELLK